MALPTDTALVQQAEAFAGALAAGYAGFLEQGRKAPTPHPTHVYASAWRLCTRRMVLEMTEPEKQAPFGPEVLARFRRGDDRERDLVNDLRRIGREVGFDVTNNQGHFAVKDRRGRQVVSGRVDGFFSWRYEAPPLTPENLGDPMPTNVVVDRRSREVRQEAPFEIKAWAPMMVDRLERFADVFENPWTRSGGYQLLLYLYAHALPIGFLILDRPGLPKILPVVLEQHLERVEEFLQKCEAAVDAALAYAATRDEAQLPAYLAGDAAECTRCPFYGRACNPPLMSPDVNVFTDEQLELDIARWFELRDAGKEWASLDDRLKKQLRGVEVGFCGPYAITGKYSSNSRLELPEEVKKQYTVRDPKGRFSLTFSKPNPAAKDPTPPAIAEQLQRSLAAAGATTAPLFEGVTRPVFQLVKGATPDGQTTDENRAGDRAAHREKEADIRQGARRVRRARPGDQGAAARELGGGEAETAGAGDGAADGERETDGGRAP